MRRQIGTKIASLIILLGFLAGCTTLHVKPPAQSELERAVGLTTPPPISADQLIQLTPEMTAFASRFVPEVSNTGIKMRELIRALVNVHGLEYEAEAHLTAAQAFEQRRANCLAFSSLVVAMANELGINTMFQEVDLPPTWLAADQNLLLQFKHVNVLVDHGRWRDPQIVDFRLQRYDESYPARLIDSKQATARFYNNVGIEAMLEGRLDEARNYVANSLLLEPELAFAWVNLGQIYRRMGDIELAEVSYRQALKIEPNNSSALTNLAQVYEKQGHSELASEFRIHANASRMGDPYFRYAMAQRAFQMKAWPDAVAWVEKAIAKRPREHRFHHLMGMIRWELGERDSAIQSIKRAAHLADQTSDLTRYERQLARWQSDST